MYGYIKGIIKDVESNYIIIDNNDMTTFNIFNNSFDITVHYL